MDICSLWALSGPELIAHFVHFLRLPLLFLALLLALRLPPPQGYKGEAHTPQDSFYLLTLETFYYHPKYAITDLEFALVIAFVCRYVHTFLKHSLLLVFLSL